MEYGYADHRQNDNGQGDAIAIDKSHGIGKVYLVEWSASQGSEQFIVVPNGGRMSMNIGY